MEQPPVLILRSRSLGFGPLRGDLTDTYLRWVNDLRVTRTLSVPCTPHTREWEERWLQGALVSDSDAVFTIYELDSMRPIGNVGLHDIDHGSGTAEFGIVIGEIDAWGQGYGTEAARMMVHYGFDVLGLHNIQLEVYAVNAGGIKAYERAGFKRIGVRRGAQKFGRERVDVLFMDITAEEVEPSDLHQLMQSGRTP
jgi:RimJ/RimL family protein N-acetyltransferase